MWMWLRWSRHATTWLAFVLLVSRWPGTLRAARFQTVSHRDQVQLIQLKSQYDLRPGTNLYLPIDVPHEPLGLYGGLTPRLQSITTLNQSGLYGPGDRIVIVLTYTSVVNVVGTPTLTLNTGCNGAYCTITEIQSFNCTADLGMFALSIGNQTVANVAANTTADQFKHILESFAGVNWVTVTLSESDIRDYSTGSRVCSSKGKNVTVTFNNVTFPATQGNVPNMHFDPTNTIPDPYSGLSNGLGSFMFQEPVSALKGINKAYLANISFYENQAGFRANPGVARYMRGSGTRVLLFEYVPRQGEFAGGLNTVSINFDPLIYAPAYRGYIYSPTSLQNVSRSIPVDMVMLNGIDLTSVSVTSVGISYGTPSNPVVLKVTSPNPDGEYTLGDSILIAVVFNSMVEFDRTLSHVHTLYMVLASGKTNNDAQSAYIANNTLMFNYSVQMGDQALLLDYKSVNSIRWFGNDTQSQIYKKGSTSKLSPAITVLPPPGKPGSLSATKRITLDTKQPAIVSLKFLTPPGLYTAGDNIDMLVVYSNPVTVAGTPLLYYVNTPTLLNAHIRNAPADPRFSFKRARPAEVAQIIVQLSLNWVLQPGDLIRLRLPGFAISDTANPRIINDAVIQSTTLRANFTPDGVWYEEGSYLELHAADAVPAYTPIKLTVAGVSGLLSPTLGLYPSASELTFDVESKAINKTVTMGYSFAQVAPIGFTYANLTMTSNYGAVTNVVFAFAVPEMLQEGDMVKLNLDGFITTIGKNVVLRALPSLPYFNLSWFAGTQDLYIFMTENNVTQLAFQVNLTRYLPLELPDRGVDVNTVVLSYLSKLNGGVTNAPLTRVTNVCGIYGSTVQYLNPVQGQVSAVALTFRPGTFGLLAGDVVSFTLPVADRAATTDSVPLTLLPYQFTSNLASTFSVKVNQYTVMLTALLPVPVDTLVSVTITDTTAVFLKVPATGVRLKDGFNVQVSSTQCTMTARRVAFQNTSRVVSAAYTRAKYTPAAPAEGTELSLSFEIRLNASLSSGDALAVGMPYVTYNPTYFTNLDQSMSSYVTSSVTLSRTVFYADSKQLRFSVAQPVAAGALISIQVQAPVGLEAGPSVPTDSFRLYVKTARNGLMGGYPMRGTVCVGFCTMTNVTYSSVFAGEPMTLTIWTSFSDIIPSNSTLLVQVESFFYPNGVPTFTIRSTNNISLPFNTTRPNKIARAKSVAVLPGGYEPPPQLAIQASWAIQKGALVQIVITGLAFRNRSVNIVPQITVNTPSIGKRALTFALPSLIYDSATFASASVTVPFGTIAGTAAPLTFTFVPANAVPAGTYLRLYLPGFTHNATMYAQPSGVSVDPTSITWDATASYLTFLLTTGVVEGTTAAVTFPGLVVPSNGLRVASGLGYFQAKSLVPLVISQMVRVATVSPVIAVYAPSVTFSYLKNAFFNLSAVTFKFALSEDLHAGDVVSYQVPSIYAAQPGDTDFGQATNKTAVSSAVWRAATATMVFTLKSELVANTVMTLRVNISQHALYVKPIGLLPTSSVTFSLFQSSALVARVTFPEPCIGVCSASLAPQNQREGFATNYLLKVVFGGRKFQLGDVLQLYLPGFFIKGPPLANNTVSMGDLSAPLNVRPTWNATKAVLTLTPYFAGGNSTFNATASLSAMILSTLQLALPKVGVQEGALNGIGWNTPDGSRLYEKVLKVSPVGALQYARVMFSRRAPSVRTGVNVSIALRGAIAAGDQITLRFPFFYVPTGPLVYEQETGANISFEYARRDFTLTGQASQVTVLMLRDLPAATPLSFYLPESLGVATPATGVYVTTAPVITVASTHAPVGSTTATSYTASAAVAVNLRVTYRNKTGTFINKAAKVRLFNMTMRNLGCALNTTDAIVVKLPNQSSYFVQYRQQR